MFGCTFQSSVEQEARHSHHSNGQTNDQDGVESKTSRGLAETETKMKKIAHPDEAVMAQHKASKIKKNQSIKKFLRPEG